MPSKDKKLILIRNDLLQEVAKITAKEGKTVFAFTNEVFEQALKAHQMQTSLPEVLELYTLLQLEKDIGSVIITSDLLSYMTNKLYKTDKEELIKKWYEAGLWYGKYLSVKFPEENWLQIFEKLIKTCSWNVTDFAIADEGENIKIRCISPNFTSENTEVFQKFLEGALHSSDYKKLKNECLKGMILLEFKKPK